MRMPRSPIHTFMPGLRFDTQWRYAVQERHLVPIRT